MDVYIIISTIIKLLLWIFIVISIIVIIILSLFSSSSLLVSLSQLLSLIFFIFEISDSMILDWVSFLTYPNLFGIKGFIVVVVVVFHKPT
jgi:hypothetical protein